MDIQAPTTRCAQCGVEAPLVATQMVAADEANAAKSVAGFRIVVGEQHYRVLAAARPTDWIAWPPGTAELTTGLCGTCCRTPAAPPHVLEPQQVVTIVKRELSPEEQARIAEADRLLARERRVMPVAGTYVMSPVSKSPVLAPAYPDRPIPQPAVHHHVPGVSAPRPNSASQVVRGPSVSPIPQAAPTTVTVNKTAQGAVARTVMPNPQAGVSVISSATRTFHSAAPQGRITSPTTGVAPMAVRQSPPSIVPQQEQVMPLLPIERAPSAPPVAPSKNGTVVQGPIDDDPEAA